VGAVIKNPKRGFQKVGAVFINRKKVGAIFINE
jgi:hypothetical protein